jgi:hypothetical protein
MLHKIFQWWYLKTRSSYGQSYKKIDSRSKERDLIHYFHDFGGDRMNVRRSYWLYRKVFKLLMWIIFLVGTGWFTYESYHGLMIYDS